MKYKLRSAAQYTIVGYAAINIRCNEIYLKDKCHIVSSGIIMLKKSALPYAKEFLFKWHSESFVGPYKQTAVGIIKYNVESPDQVIPEDPVCALLF